MRRISWVLLLALSAVTTSAQAVTLNALQTKLARTGAKWIAGPTKMSRLTRDEQKRMLGAEIADHSDFFFEPKTNRIPTWAPASHDWRNAGGINYSSPILDQGRCGSCVAFAAIALLETQMNISQKTPHSPWAYSPQHLFSCGGGGCARGWQAPQALSFLQNTGVPDEACFPYESGAVGKDIACNRTCSDSKSRSTKITRSSMTSFFFVSMEALKKALQKGPLMATMAIYEDFMFYKGGVYSHTSGAQLGGHAVTIEGWNDADKAWIVRNSWGEEWGEKGYFRVAWDDDSGVGSSTWSIEVGQLDGRVGLGSLRDNAVLTGVAAIEVESTFADTQRIRWQLLSGATKVLEGEVAQSETVMIDTSAIAEGVYQLIAIADRASTMVYSQPRTVYVLNGLLTGSVSIDNVKEGDVLTGKKVLEFSLQSTPVPFSRLLFKALNLTTGEIVERHTPHVAPKINLSFNTALRGNGDWEISLSGLAGGQTVQSPTVTVKIQN